ncbi:MAG: hypothetical protein ACFB0E_09540 [Leptolyngbyaceae cyanobacterium]
MRPKERRNFRASFNASDTECRKALAEYSYLANLPQLSEAQLVRMADILQLAETNDVLSCLINEVDEMTFQELDLYIDGDFLTHFKNESARVQEEVLNGHECQILMCFSTVRGQETVRYRTLNVDRPRMEMVFDATHSHDIRQSLNQLLLLEQTSVGPVYESFCLADGHVIGKKSPFSHIKRLFFNIFVEESVSWFTLAALGFLIGCLIIL